MSEAIELKPRPCTRCKGTAWVPDVEPEGAFLKVIEGVHVPCPQCKTSAPPTPSGWDGTPGSEVFA